MNEPTPLNAEQQQALQQLQDLLAMAEAMGLPAATLERVQGLADRLVAGEDLEQLQGEGEALVAELMGAAPQEAPAQPAEPDLVYQLALAEQLGQHVTLTPQQAGELADLAAFAVWARDEAYPVTIGLQPLVARISELGAEVQTATPLQLASIIASGLRKP